VDIDNFVKLEDEEGGHFDDRFGDEKSNEIGN
jgi:hypothetical protein